MNNKFLRLVIRLGVYASGFMMVAATIAVMFVYYGSVYDLGVSEPTKTQFFELSQHGRSVYVTYQQYMTVAISQYCLLTGFVGWAALLLMVHYRFGIHIFYVPKAKSSKPAAGGLTDPRAG